MELKEAHANRPALRAEGLGFDADGRPLLNGIDLEVDEGELVALVGPNGSGKTTLLRCLAGILRSARGRLEMRGKSIDSMSRRKLARELVYLPQDTTTNFEITVLDAVALGRYPHLSAWRAMSASDWEIVEQSLTRLGLQALRHRVLPTLSGGERQRVFLARALAQEAEIFILDEPTTALDIGHQLELMDVLASLHEEGRTIVVAMHDLHLVFESFPRSILLDRGESVADGVPRDVLVGAEAERAFRVQVRMEGDRPIFERAPANAKGASPGRTT